MPEKKEPIGVDTAWFDEQFSIAGTSIRAVARRGRFDPATLSRVVRGKIPLNLACAIALADAFGVTIEEIIKRCAFQLPLRKGVKTHKTIRAALISKARIKKIRQTTKIS